MGGQAKVEPGATGVPAEGVRVLLEKGLRALTCLWALNDPAVVVMNQQIAIRQGLIHANANSFLSPTMHVWRTV